jgi:ATP-dependent Clp protease ATP-binding subunit ClpA
MIEPSKKLQTIFDSAVVTAQTLSHEYVTIEHLLYSILCDQESYDLIESHGAKSLDIKNYLENYLQHQLNSIKSPTAKRPKKTHAVERVLNRCFTQVLFSGRQKIEIQDIIVSILNEKNSFAYFFLTKGGVVREEFVKSFSESIIEHEEHESQVAPNTSNLDKIINSFCTNLSMQAKQKKLEQVNLLTYYLLISIFIRQRFFKIFGIFDS